MGRLDPPALPRAPSLFRRCAAGSYDPTRIPAPVAALLCAGPLARRSGKRSYGVASCRRMRSSPAPSVLEQGDEAAVQVPYDRRGLESL